MKYFIIIFLLNSLSLFSNKILSYKQIEPTLLETWDKTYPVSYKKIIKFDTVGKGIMLLNTKEYLYTFLVFVSDLQIENGQQEILETGKEITIKLYFNPSKEENKYRIELGEVLEKYNQRNVIKWIK